jgi:hypothetical protein
MTDNPGGEGFQSPKAIDLRNLGEVPLLNDGDLEEIRKETGLELLEHVDRSKFLWWLNNTIERNIRERLAKRLTRQELETLKSNISKYRDVSRSLLDSEFPPPLLPPPWLDSVERWIAAAEAALNGRSAGGASQNSDIGYFLPRLLGLFHAGFGVEPKVSTSWNRENPNGGAFRFAQSVLCVAGRKINERGFSHSVPSEVQARARLGPVSDDTMKKRMKVALQRFALASTYSNQGRYYFETQRLVPSSYSQCDLAWKLYSLEFRRQINVLRLAPGRNRTEKG